MNFKDKIKCIFPRLLNRITGLFYGWSGDFSSWEEAKRKCTGYSNPDIIKKVKESALMVKQGKVAFERDSVIFDQAQYSFPLLAGLMWIAGQNNGKIRVLDFGGSLGSTYFQNRLFLDSLSDVKWCIVEQPDFVKVGKQDFADERLQFYNTIDECLLSNDIDVVLLSSVIQYLEKPFELLDKIRTIGATFILIDRTPFIKEQDRITIQKVPSRIYKAKYPCWFFNEKKLLSYFTTDYNLIYEFDALDKANIKSEFKGYLFKQKNRSK